MNPCVSSEHRRHFLHDGSTSLTDSSRPQVVTKEAEESSQEEQRSNSRIARRVSATGASRVKRSRIHKGSRIPARGEVECWQKRAVTRCKIHQLSGRRERDRGKTGILEQSTQADVSAAQLHLRRAELWHRARLKSEMNERRSAG